MNNPLELQEQLGPQARLQGELLKLDSQKRELWVLVLFAAAVLLLGTLSFLFPGSFWRANELEIRIPPQVLFVLMMVVLILALFGMRREVEIQKYRLANVQQILSARSEQAASMIDTATNVFNRSILRDLLQGEIARAERNKRELALIMCDVNNFKQVNDRYGHLMGDYVLAQLAAILKTCVRGSDYVVRYGGDEFLLILPETDQGGVEIVRGRIDEKVVEWDRENRVGDLEVSVSLGVYLHTAGQTAEQDVSEADARMYAAKQAFNRKARVTGTAPARG
jgi:diguanylate cyclase (GGDEF)-like protein